MLGSVGFEPSAEQAAILYDPSMVKLVAGGERGGKSRLGGTEIIANTPDGSLIWIVGPEYEQAQAEFQYAYEDFQTLGALDGRASMPDTGQWHMCLKGGVEIETKTGQEVMRLAGKAPSGILMVEAGQQPFDVFLKLFARTAEGRARGEGWLTLLGTFEKGRRWYAELFRQMQGPNQYGGRSFSLPTWSNLAVFSAGRNDPAIKAIEAGLTAEMFRERFGGEPVAHEDQVFRGESIEKCIGPLGQADGWVVLGCDLARVRDYTVVVALNSLRQVIEIQRFRRVDWALQVQRIVEMYERLRALRIAVDSTGVGDPIAELLWRQHLLVDSVKMTSESKAELIDRLSLVLDRGEITIPRDEALIAELWDFQSTERDSGHDRLEASEGKHDDLVIGLALAVHANRSVPVGVIPVLPPPNEEQFQRVLREHFEFEIARSNEDGGWLEAHGEWSD
jgi:hypothetical protein